jgi:predicted alpha/beta-fold hydrolase
VSLAPAKETVQPASADSWLQEFIPPWCLRNGHLQTIVGNFLPRTYNLPEPEARWIEVEPATSDHGPTQVVCQCHWQPEPGGRLTMLLLHGLEGSANSQYVLGNASRAWAAGLNVVRMNMRSCGGGDKHSPLLYHSGRSQDVYRVMMEVVREHALPAVALVGYSMGGNMVLKLAGELGSSAPPQLKAVIGVSPLMDLSASSDALHEPQNRFYERRFLRAMLRRFRYKAELFPHIYLAGDIDNICRSVRTMRDFDEHIVARYSGFTGADDYYTQVSSSRVVANISTPTLILHASDDPFIRMLPETRARLMANPTIILVETTHGGHCAFLSREPRAGRYWAEKTLLDYLLATTQVC